MSTERTELILPGQANVVRLPEPKNPMAQTVARVLDRIIPVLPDGVVARQFCVAVMSEINAITKPCDPKSVLMAAFNCAVIGWIPGKALGHAYFIPYGREVQLVGGYKGYLDLAFGNEFLIQCNPEVILDGEDAEVWHDETGKRLHHKIPIKRDLRRDRVIAAYCTYRTRLGGSGIAIVPRSEIDKVDKQKDVWKSNYVAMAKKTAILRAAKEWKLTHRLGLAIQLDEQAERGEQQMVPAEFDDILDKEPARRPLNLDEIPDAPTANMAPPPPADELIARIKAATDGDTLGQQWEFAQELHSVGAYDDDTFGRVRSAYLARKAALKI